MKMYLFILILAFISSCGNTNETTKINSPAPSSSEAVTPPENIVTPAPQNMIVGKFKKDDLQQEPFASWFNKGYEEFTPSPEAMETIKKHISDYEIVGFVGTWCPDSRREIPKFYKILEDAGYDMSKLTMVGVTRGKSTPENLEEGYDMHRVPTFIFMKDGKEVNRFVEYAAESTEDDIAKIVSGAGYKNSYAQ